MDKETEILLSEKEIKVGDKLLVVKRFSLLDTIRLASQASGVVAHIMGDSAVSASALTKLSFQGENEEETNGIRLMGLVELLSVVGDEGTEFIKMCISKATNLEYDEVEQIDSIAGIDLLFTIYEVNKGFFSKLLGKITKKETKKKKAEKSE